MRDFSRGKISRRDFLKGSLASAAGAAGLLSLGACSPSATTTIGSPENVLNTTEAPETQPTNTPSQESSVEMTYRVYDTDVVVVGGGLSGTMAAYSALKENARVIIVDKGPYGHSGASGINWGTWMNVMGYETGSGNVASTHGMANQQLGAGIAVAGKEMDPLQLGTKAGSVYGRKIDGTLEGGVVEYPGMSYGNATVFMPRLFAHYVKNLGAKIMDRTMVTDLLLSDDGSVCGVVAFDIVNGEAVLVRSKSVVMATGSSCWLHGWATAGAKTNSGVECTGDGPAILLNRGLKLQNFENQYFYSYISYPEGIAYSQTIGVQSSDHPYNLSNTKGEYFMKKWAEKYPVLAEKMNSTNYFPILMAELEAGNFTEKDGCYLDIKDISGDNSHTWRSFNRHRDEDIESAFGIELGDKVEVLLCAYTTPIRPQLDPNTCETLMTGLFYANELEDSGGIAGNCALSGHMSGKNAALHAKKTNRKAFDEESMVASVGSIYEVLTHTTSTGKRPIEIQHMIQNIVHEKAFYLTTEEGLNEAIAELKRIKAEEIPNMKIVDDSRNYNVEWKQALEVPFMWQNAMAMALSRLNRKESRGSHFRKDYPLMDNENFLKNQFIGQSGDEFTSEFTDVVTLSMDPEAIKEAIVDISHITEEIRNQNK